MFPAQASRAGQPIASSAPEHRHRRRRQLGNDNAIAVETFTGPFRDGVRLKTACLPQATRGCWCGTKAAGGRSVKTGRTERPRTAQSLQAMKPTRDHSGILAKAAPKAVARHPVSASCSGQRGVALPAAHALPAKSESLASERQDARRPGRQTDPRSGEAAWISGRTQGFVSRPIFQTPPRPSASRRKQSEAHDT